MVSATNILVLASHIKVKITNRQDPKNVSVGLSWWDLGLNNINEVYPFKTPASLLRFPAVGNSCGSSKSHSKQLLSATKNQSPNRHAPLGALPGWKTSIVPLNSQHIISFQFKFGKKPKPNCINPLNSYPDISDSWKKNRFPEFIARGKTLLIMSLYAALLHFALFNVFRQNIK